MLSPSNDVNLIVDTLLNNFILYLMQIQSPIGMARIATTTGTKIMIMIAYTGNVSSTGAPVKYRKTNEMTIWLQNTNKFIIIKMNNST